ncbi:protein FAR1-RELATED SEQUENCE 6 [Nicotiana tabacum]|uniref:Protein FAR1-RELATED SEQUENCE n=1 Tax=Nicotiana tabacum TaxID=4097 RepID=A0A1S3XGQ8_TOBAC|nr:PREDICTED: protein FAR1-RELATED SEQUENCE 6-like [Nicotiana tabacum]
MDGLSLNAEPIFDDETEEFKIDGECAMTEYVGQSGVIEGKNPVLPAVGMEFETYEDVYYFYNCYAKVQGFGVRVSNTWYRKSRERYRGKLSCSSAGFKKKSEANRPRPETRTGCPAMIKFRLMANKRWRIIEVELEHNHLLSPSAEKFYKSHRNISSGSKRPLQMDANQDVQKIRLFRTVIIDPDDDRKLNIDEGEFRNTIDQSNNHLILKSGDAQAIHSFFIDLQLVNPDFFYVMDLNEKGCLRNVFWAEARFKAAYNYFGDVVRIDTACLTTKYEVPLVVIAGVNHHGQSVPLGCGLVAGETVESFIWLLRAWLTYMVGRPPQTIIIDQSRAMQTAIADVLPQSSHCISLSHIMKKVPEELGGLHEYEVIKKEFTKAIYQSSRTDEFEAAWEDMILCHGIRDHKWLQTLHEDRKHWVPVYLKDTFLAGMFPITVSEKEASPFDEYLSNHTPLKEFLDAYNQCPKEIYQREALADTKSRNSSFMLKSRFYFEMQLSKVYTNHIFEKFQIEIEGMFSCLSTRQVSIDGSIVTYMVKEHEVENVNEARDYEVTLNTVVAEVLCACGLFNLEGFLCRHALCVLSQNGFEEIPPQYILSRWRKDIHRSYVLDYGCNLIDTKNSVHRYDNLYKCAVKLVEEGRKSNERYKFTLEALGEILKEVSLQDHNTL